MAFVPVPVIAGVIAMPHRFFLRFLFALLAAACLSMPMSVRAAAAESGKAAELLALHDWKTAVAIGNRYLVQESLVAVRAELTRIGREHQLGPAWKRGNPQWAQAEAVMLPTVLAMVRQDWIDLSWLSAPWTEMIESSFKPGDIDPLAAHFRTDVGSKQAMLIAHSVAFHVSGALTMSGRFLQDYPGTEQVQKDLTYIWDDEDRASRFSIAATDNIEGQRFALSALGVRYQKTLMIKLTGIINARLYQVASRLPGEAVANVRLAEPAIAAFAAANPR